MSPCEGEAVGNDELRWFTSSYSGGNGNGCVEVNIASDAVLVRDTKTTGSPEIIFTLTQWAHWLDEIATDTLTNTNGAVTVTTHNNIYRVHEPSTGATLNFTGHEWTAFRNGVLDGEFTLSAVTPV